MTSECFKEYKDRHLGEAVFIIGSGPTFSVFEEEYHDRDELTSIDKIGCNGIVYSSILMDYYFVGDQHFGGKSPDSFMNRPTPVLEYVPTKAKFCRKTLSNYLKGDPPGFNVYHTARYEKQGYKYMPTDIVNEPINQVGSISMDVMQFALYSGYRTFFLVGHDCNYAQKKTHFNTDAGKGVANMGDRIIRAWQNVQSLIDESYPDARIFIINPVSLRIFPTVQISDIPRIVEERKQMFEAER